MKKFYNIGPSGFLGASLLGKLLPLPKNIALSWIGLLETNTLAYLAYS
jgi:hypothetical protein